MTERVWAWLRSIGPEGPQDVKKEGLEVAEELARLRREGAQREARSMLRDAEIYREIGEEEQARRLEDEALRLRTEGEDLAADVLTGLLGDF